MSDKKTIAVIGATGAQGGGLVRAIIADPERRFAVRAITRKTDSDKARALAAAGAEVVAGDADDPASLERAFAGAHGAFLVTNFWEHFSPERELNQAAAMARATKAAGVAHAVWSTLEDTRLDFPLDDPRLKTLQGKYKVPHFDAKGEADAVFAAEAAPTSYLMAAFYWENFIFFGQGPRKGADGNVVLALPLGGGKLPGIAAEDIGKCAYGIFKAGTAMIGKTVGVSGEHLSGGEIAAGLSRALNETVDYVAVKPEQYRAFGFPGADDLGNMFQFKTDFNERYRAARDVNEARRLNPALQRFDDWLRDNAKRIPTG